ncbi:phytanoyl-CoA dioxygenase family protein [Paenibacillus koleovorans]|uniref:phytanoyl-CoA dioxygenase family protein n=1 Tax=Paenibacillus koleovorans TaxID=121608 RepID=UPI000FD8094B|nr:phytanoyl-CoA dioxygenase family protein [Paenibacillus koleovorans]
MKPAENQLEIKEKLYRFDKIASHRVATPDDVTDEVIKQYKELGYLAIENVLTPEEVQAAIQDIDDAIQGRIQGPKLQWMKDAKPVTAEDREMAVRKLSQFIDYCPATYAVAYHTKIQSILKRIFEDEVKFCADQAILKPPSNDAGIEKPWHQDMAYPNFSFTKMVAGVWVALDEAGLDNGCMHIIPKSHREGAVPHYSIRDWQLCDASVNVERDETVPLKPGGLLIFSGLLHHGTPPNLSAKRRRALQFHYAPESAVKMTPDQFKAVFTSEMTQAEC